MRLFTVLRVVVLLGMLPATAAQAEEQVPGGHDSWLQWQRGRSATACPSAAELAAKVAAHLDTSPAALAGRAHITISAHVDSVAPGPGRGAHWLAESRVLDAAGAVIGSRTISDDGDACGPITDALALVTALLLSQQPAEAKPPRAPPEPPSPAPPHLPAPTPLRSSARPEQPTRPANWHAEVEGGPSLQVGMLPGMSPMGEARVVVGPPAWPAFFASFALAPAAQATVSENRGASISQWTAGAGVCALARSALARTLGLCIGADVGRLRASGFGFDTLAVRERLVLDMALGANAQLPIAQGFFLGVGVRAVLPLVRTRVAYTDTAGETEDVYRAWPIAAVGHLRLGYAFR